MKSILTRNNDARVIARLDSADIAKKWQESLSIDVGENFKNLGKIEYLECDVTGFRWYSPSHAAGGPKLYEQLEKFDWYYMREKWEFTLALKLLEGVKTVLEIGVGEGNFLRSARSSGFHIQGVELNPKGAERARYLGFEVHEKMLDDLGKNIGDRFDAICSFQVLEHVPDPFTFIQGMIGLLRPGGKIILSVPNAGVMRKIDPKNYDLLNQPPHHMGHWDENVFRSLEQLLPLKLRSVHKEPLASYHIGWMVNGFLRNKLSFLGKTIPRFLINRFTTLPLQWAMRAGLSRLFPGHTLLVEFEYLPN